MRSCRRPAPPYTKLGTAHASLVTRTDGRHLISPSGDDDEIGVEFEIFVIGVVNLILANGAVSPLRIWRAGSRSQYKKVVFCVLSSRTSATGFVAERLPH